MEFRNFSIGNIAFHQIYRREIKDVIVEPYYSEKCTELSLEGKNTIKTRIIKSLGNNSHALKMEIDDVGEESVYCKIVNYWNGEKSQEKFLEMSKEITYLLAKAQDRRQYPGGIVIVIEGTVSRNNDRCICIIKADIHDGLNIEDQDGVQELSYIDNLLLTPSQKLQKIGMFVDKSRRANVIEPHEVETYIYDSNTDRNATLNKAEYFYNGFLGLKFSSENDMMTNNFYKYTREFINSRESFGSAKKNELQTQLINYIYNTGNTSLNTSTFADLYFDNSVIRDDYIRFMSSNAVPNHDIMKDMSLIDIKRRNLVFENSIKLQAPTEEFARNVVISEDNEGNTIIKIRGRLMRE